MRVKRVRGGVKDRKSEQRKVCKEPNPKTETRSYHPCGGIYVFFVQWSWLSNE